MAEPFETEESGATTGAINPPNLSSSLKPRTRAIKNEQQARNIIQTLQETSRERNQKNARIMAKYNAEKPYTQTELNSEGLGWKSNFTTQPLPMLIDKVAPRFVKAVEGAKYLTNSSLPDSMPGAAKKTETFRREITSTIRARPGWSNFVSEFAQENALFGFTAVAWLDEFSWFPKHFRQDKFNTPTGNGQMAKSTQIITLYETFLVHELFELISDKEAAAAAGWDVPRTVRAINSAIPESRRSQHATWERIHEDLQREANVGLSHEAGALTVSVWHLLATEIDGKVSHYILLDQPAATEKDQTEGGFGGDTLFEREDRFPSMENALALFSFQNGNGKLAGSKGIGRQIYSLAGMLDKARNEVVDRLNLAGKIIIQGDDKALRRFKMSVVGNTILIGQGYNISDRKLDPAVEPFLELDEFLTRLLDQMAGATTPKAFEGDRVTKAQVDLFASREEESRDNIIGRFLTQFVSMVSTMQQRMCDPQVSEQDAKDMQKRLLETMTREELDQLASNAVAETVRDFTEIQRQQVVLIAQEARGNPLYNQREIERRKLTALIDEEFADSVLLPEEDPTVTAEQTRLQQMELLIIVGQAAAVPVSPRDNHLIHLEVMAPAMESAAAEAATNGVQGLEVLQALAAHAEAHFTAAEQTGTPKETLAPIKKFLDGLRKAINQLNELEAQTASAAPVEGAAAPPPAV